MAFTTAAVSFALTMPGSAFAAGRVATAATPATAATAGAAGVGTPVDFPGTVAAKPAAETLFSAGTTGFLHQRAGSNDMLWTRYDTGATVTAFTASAAVAPLSKRQQNAGWFGAGSDVAADYDWRTGATVTLHDMGAGGAQTVVPLNGLTYDGTYGRTVIALGAAGAAAGAGVHLLTPDGSGGVTDVLVTGLPAEALGRTSAVTGDAGAVLVQWSPARNSFLHAVVDLTTGVATPVVLDPRPLAVNPLEVAFSPTSVLYRAGGSGPVRVFSRSDLSAAPVTVTPPANTAAWVAQVGGSLLAIQGPQTAETYGGALTATPEAGGAVSTLLKGTDDEILQTPDGGALIAGNATGKADSWGFYRITAGASASAAPVVAEVASSMYQAPSPVDGFALERGTATVWSGGDSGSIWSRTLGNGSFAAPVTLTNVGSGLATGPLIATGDGQLALSYFDELSKVGPAGWTAGISGAGGQLVAADGRYALYGNGGLTAGDFRYGDPLGQVTAPGGTAASTGALWAGFAYVSSGQPGGVVVEDLGRQRVAGVLATGATCAAPQLQVVRRWLYWSCDTHTAGIDDLADGARLTLPASGSGYDDALLGDGFVVHHDASAQQLVLDDVHTDADTSTTPVAPLTGGTSAPDRGTAWTVDRYSAELGWRGDDNVFHVAPVVGVPASAAWTPSSTAPSVPAWLTPVAFTLGQGVSNPRECTGVRIAPTRVLTTADCETGHGGESFGWGFDRATGQMQGGGSNPTYLLDRRYDKTTRQDDLSVVRSYDNASSNVAVLAGPADGALYRPGTTAVFYSWSGLGWNGDGGIRTPHAENVQLQSAATCARLLGRALPSGSVCTTPAPGAAPVAAQDQCEGDAGGALVAGGKLIGTSATPVGGCASGAVRLYTATSPRYALERGWSRDVGAYGGGLGFGGITARASDGIITAFCSSDMHGCLNGGVGNLSDGFRQMNLVIPAGDMTGSGNADLLVRSTSGALYRFWGTGSGDLDSRGKTLLGHGWNQYTRILAPGDLTGDGLTDVVAIDRSGVMWLYPGTANGLLGHRVRVGGGWNTYNLVAGHGGLTSDGFGGLVARDRQGRLWTYLGNGHGGFQRRVYVGSGWGAYNTVVLGGDLDGQGNEELLARRPDGQCNLYVETGDGGFRYLGRAGGNGWERYAQLN